MIQHPPNKQKSKGGKAPPKKQVSKNMAKGSKKTQQNRTTNSPATQCPYKKNTQTPCDVEKLTITEKGGRNVVTSQPLSLRSPTQGSKLSASRKHLAATYDLVLEMVAPFISSGGTKETAGEDAKTNIKADVVMCGACPGKDHPAIAFTPLNNGSDDKEVAKDYKAATTGEIYVFGRALASDKKAIPELDFRYYWPFGNSAVKECTIKAASCGVRLKGKPKLGITGLIRIYRKEEYELNVTVPAFHSWKVEKKGHTEDGKKEREVTYQRKAGDEVRAETSVKSTDGNTTERTFGFTREDGTYVKGTKEVGKPLQVELVSTSYGYATSEQSTTTSTPSTGESETNTKFQIQPQFSLKRNGRELKITETINQILNFANTIKDALKAFQECVPKVGFRLSLEISAFEGSIGGKWGVRVDSSSDTAEYKWVSPYLDLSVNLTILKVVFTAMYGIEVKSPAILYWAEGDSFELTAKVEFKLELEAKLQTTLTLGPEDPEAKTAPFQGDSKITAEVKVVVNVFGYGMRARAGVDGGFEIEGAAIYGPNDPFKIAYKVHRKKWSFVAYFTAPGKGEPSPDYEYELWAEAKNWRNGTVFGGP